MCYSVCISKPIESLEARFTAELKKGTRDLFTPDRTMSGFTHPYLPVITNEEPGNIQFFKWGLIPFWAKDEDIAKNTLNARIESIGEKPSFRASVKHRCLVLVDGFYEWQWLDEKGKKKQKFLITTPDSEAFAIGGLWNIWTNRETGELLKTFTILTKPAVGIMEKIHNSKLRMPVILSRANEVKWLNGGETGEEVELKGEVV